MEQESTKQAKDELAQCRYSHHIILAPLAFIAIYALVIAVTPTDYISTALVIPTFILMLVWMRAISRIGKTKMPDWIMQWAYHGLAISKFLSYLRRMVQSRVLAWLRKISVLTMIVWSVSILTNWKENYTVKQISSQLTTGNKEITDWNVWQELWTHVFDNMAEMEKFSGGEIAFVVWIWSFFFLIFSKFVLWLLIRYPLEGFIVAIAYVIMDRGNTIAPLSNAHAAIILIPEIVYLYSLITKNLPWASFIAKKTSHGVSFVQMGYESYVIWRDRVNSALKTRDIPLPLMIDAPISTEEEDRLWHTEKAEEIYEYINSADPSHAIIIGVDGERGSGKTSVTNILQNNYLAFAKDSTLTYEFHAWSYPNGTILQNFLTDFWGFCEKNWLEIRDNIQRYIDIASKVDERLDMLRYFHEQKSDAEQLKEASKKIRQHGKKIVVIIDDVDRITNREDLESLLKLFRSTANWRWVYYVINYSYRELMGTGWTAQGASEGAKNAEDKAQNELRPLLVDFHSKYVNFRVEMPNSPVALSDSFDNKNKLLEYYRSECKKRVSKVIPLMLRYYETDILERLREIQSSDNYAMLQKKYKQHHLLKYINELIEDKELRERRMGDYLANGSINFIWSWGDFGVVDKDWILPSWITTTFLSKPRSVVGIVNTALRSLRDEGLRKFDHYFTDLEKRINNESTSSQDADDLIRWERASASATDNNGELLMGNSFSDFVQTNVEMAVTEGLIYERSRKSEKKSAFHQGW